MRKIIALVLILFAFITIDANSQITKEESYSVLAELVGGTWIYKGEWENGKTFKQEMVVTWGLQKKIIKVETKGIIDQETNAYGLRNEGIRAWDSKTYRMKFYEFDIFGGVTEGYCVFETDRFHYEYVYKIEGKEEMFRDTWRRIDANTYEFSVNMKTDRGWETYTTNQYKRISN